MPHLPLFTMPSTIGVALAKASDTTQNPFHPPSFIRLANGRNVIRLTRKPSHFGVHFYSVDGKSRRAFCEGNTCMCCAGRATYANLIGYTENGLPRYSASQTKDLEPNERRALERYSMWAIQNRTLRILEVGKTLYAKIAKVVQESKEPLETYDIIISRSGEGIQTRYDVERATKFLYGADFWKEINDQIDKFSMRALVGDPEARAEMYYDLEQEQRVLDKSW